jgi:D-alanyl-D-alanine carboxypeptidase
MKTGFICSSGFNVVASANRNGRRLVTVVLGAPSANERTMQAAELFDRGFGSKVNFTNPELTSLPASATHAPPDMRSVICDRRGPMPREEDSPSVAEEGTGVPNLFSEVLAFTGDVQKPARTVLGPRTAVQPERVWIGAAPPSETEVAAQAAAEEAAEQARKAAKLKKTAARTVKATASTEPTVKAPDVTPVIEKELDKAAGKGKDQQGKDQQGKDQPRASVTLKPVTDQAKPAAAKPPAAKPVAAKPAAAKPAAAKPAPTTKPDAVNAAAAKVAPKPAADTKPKPQKADAAAKPKSVAN